ncbi:MAG: class I SAM-dependent methyltransferase [Thermoplasmata archaeon]|nr:class I SAM-dependent methyltransferase [Thermoplasmata archaeon]
MSILKDHEDAQGHAIYDRWKGKEVREIIEREDGYLDATDGPEQYLSEYKDWPLHEKKAMKLAKGKVLDIGSGAGRHAIYLQNKGLDVLGIDNSPMALKVAKERGLKKTKLLSITQITSKLGKFDTITMMGHNFGLFSNFKRARWLLKRFHSITTNDALIIAETLDIYDTDKPGHLWYQEYNRKRGKMSGQLKLRVRYKKYINPWFEYLMVSKEEMEEILDGTGWKVVKYLDHLPHYIAIIKKE